MEADHESSSETGERRREQLVADENSRAELALAGENIGLWSLDLATREVTVDQRARNIWGLPASKTVSLAALEALIHPDDRERRRSVQLHALDPMGDGSFSVEYRIAATADTPERWVAVRGQTQGSVDRPTAIIGTIRNITLRKQAEAQAMLSRQQLQDLRVELLERSRQLEAMYESAVNAILTIDARGNIQSINAATTKLFGYTADLLIGRNVSVLMPEPYAREHDGYLGAYLQTGRRKIIGIGREVTARRADGSVFPIHLAVSEYHANGQRYFTGIITDLSDREAAELALRETERQLAQAQKMEAVGQLTGGLAHDFNNLLTVITGNLELLELRLEGEVEHDLLRRAQEAAHMGARLTGRLLTFSRRGTLQPTVLNLNDTIIGMTELLRRSLGETISLTCALAPTLWNTKIDASEIENAILNLAINARDAMPSGGRIEIETSNVELTASDLEHVVDAASGAHVKLSVRDDGSGMSSDVMARAFEPFFTTKPPGRGTGLGLSTIYGFVKQSGGHATISSDVGRGTIVSLYLPRDTGTSSMMAPALSVDPPDHINETVLVVEDNEEVRDVTVKRLHTMGYDVVVAENGPAAIAMLTQRKQIDLVFSDVVMPGGMSGFDVLRWVQSNRAGVRVLLTSGYAGDATTGAPVIDANTNFLRKPYTHTELARAIRAALRR